MRPARVIIGLTGAPGAGKDSCAEVLRRHGYRSIAFADALRTQVAEAFRLDARMLTERATKELPLNALAIGMCNDPSFVVWASAWGHDLRAPRSARWIVQQWGTDFRRSTCSHYWVQLLQDAIYSGCGTGHLRWVITDVRMANEAELVRALGGRLFRVVRPEIESTQLADDTAGHVSELQARVLATDDVIRNDGSLDALADEVEQRVFNHFGAEALPNPRKVTP